MGAFETMTDSWREVIGLRGILELCLIFGYFLLSYEGCWSYGGLPVRICRVTVDLIWFYSYDAFWVRVWRVIMDLGVMRDFQ